MFLLPIPSLPTCTLFGKTKGEGREDKGEKRGERKGKRNDKFFPFPCLVCKGKMEGNTHYWWVPPLVLSPVSHFPPNLGGKHMVGHKGICFLCFPFLHTNPSKTNK